MSESPTECLRKTYVKLRYIPPPDPHEPADCSQVQLQADPDILIIGPPPGMRTRWFDWRPADELIGIEMLCDVISLEGEGSIIFLFEVGAYITWWLRFITKQKEFVTEFYRIYLSIPIMVKLPGSHILLSRLMPTWMRLGHYVEEIVVAAQKTDEVEEMLGKISLLKAGICPENIDKFKLALQVIEDAANKILQGAGSDDELAWSMRGKPPFYAQLAGSRMRIG